MMQYLNHLPIWRDAHRLLLAIEQAVRPFPRHHEYRLGKTMRRAGLSYGLVAEQGYWPGGMIRRVLRNFFVGPIPSSIARADPGLVTPPTLGLVGATTAPSPFL